MPYRIKKAFLKHPYLHTTVDGKKVALVAAYTYTTRATATRPPVSVSVPMATQAQLKAVFDRGDPVVEKYEEEKTFSTLKSKTPDTDAVTMLVEQQKEDEPE